MPQLPFLFDAVIFDLDGTLVATDRFWVDAARAGARRAFAELGIERSMPSAAQWMNLVGLPLAQGFTQLFADLTPAQRALVMERCVEEEHQALREGQAALLPGVIETLSSLRAKGVRLGVASNCGEGYLSSMMRGLGLERWIEEPRCLDSEGVSSKAAMVAQLLEVFGTRAAVMVGDRIGDRDAAWQNGLPHVHLARGFAGPGEIVECEAVIEDIGALLPLLSRRARWIEAALERVGVFREPAPRSLGITGHSGAGKTLFARDVGRVLDARGVRSHVIALDDFERPGLAAQRLPSSAFAPMDRPLEHLAHAFDVEGLIEHVLTPHARGAAVEHTLPSGASVRVAADELIVLHGLFLLHPTLRPHLERVVHLAASDNLVLRRVAGRDARTGPEGLMRLRRHFLPVQRAFDELCDPRTQADLVLEAESPFGADLPAAP